MREHNECKEGTRTRNSSPPADRCQFCQKAHHSSTTPDPIQRRGVRNRDFGKNSCKNRRELQESSIVALRSSPQLINVWASLRAIDFRSQGKDTTGGKLNYDGWERTLDFFLAIDPA